MAVKTREQLQAEAAQIANETGKRLNTALRVGNAMRDIIDSAPSVLDVTGFGALTTASGVDNDVAIAAAIAAASAVGADLYWPAGTFTSAASIASLHSVRHRGPGAIQRGADVFYVEPKSSSSNTLYVAATGSAANDGLSSAQPMRGFQNAIDALKNYGPTLEGTWTVQFAAGTYNTTVTDYGTTNRGIRSRNPIILKGATVGGYPNVPTTIVAYTGGTAQGWAFVDFMNVDIRDVKFQDFTTGQAVLVEYGSRVKLTNVHGFNNLYALYAALGVNAEVVSGVFDANSLGSGSHGLIALDECFLQVGVTGAVPTGVVCKNAGQGVGIYEASSAHVNATLQDNAYGARLDSSARCNFDTADFKRNTTAAIRLGGNSNGQSDTCTFNTGGADANTRNIVAGGGGVDSTVDENTTTPRVYLGTQNQVTHTGTTTETVVGSFAAFPAKRFPHTFNVSKMLEALCFGTYSGASGIRTFRARLHTTASGGATGTVLAAAVVSGCPTGSFRYDLRSSFGTTSQRANLAIYNEVNGQHAMGHNENSVATNDGSDWYVLITVQLGSSGDTVVFNHREMRISG